VAPAYAAHSDVIDINVALGRYRYSPFIVRT